MTTIKRDGAGRPTKFTGFYGQETVLQTDANGYLAKIAPPAGGALQLTYDAGGLMKTLTDPLNGVHTYSYDGAGRLIRDENADHHAQTLARTVSGTTSTVTLTTPTGRKTTYVNETLPTGEHRRTVTDPMGGKTVSVVSPDGTASVMLPSGEVDSYTLGPDPRFGMASPLIAVSTVTTPGGRTRTTSTARTVELADPGDPLTLKRLVDSTTVNGHSTTTTYDAAAHTLTARSANGAESVTTIDGQRRPTHFELPGIEPVDFDYDDDGRISRRIQGDRIWRYQYADVAQGETSGEINPDNDPTNYAYDAAGRVLSTTVPGGRTTALAYDPAGDVSGVTPPGRPQHTLTYTAQGLIKTYLAPASSNETLTYDADDMLAAIDRPGANDATFGYDTAGRLSKATDTNLAEDITFGYAGATSRQSEVKAPSETVDTTFDGPLPLKDTFSGDASGVLTRSYDDDLRVSSTRIGTSTTLLLLRRGRSAGRRRRPADRARRPTAWSPARRSTA